MSVPQWERITELFQAALERPAARREVFLLESCGGDQKLYKTVQALLDADQEAGEFMENPLLQATLEFPDSGNTS